MISKFLFFLKSQPFGIQTVLSEKTGIKKSTINSWVKHDRNPSYKLVMKIIKAFPQDGWKPEDFK